MTGLKNQEKTKCLCAEMSSQGPTGAKNLTKQKGRGRSGSTGQDGIGRRMIKFNADFQQIKARRAGTTI